jgi:hypothetical protein
MNARVLLVPMLLTLSMAAQAAEPAVPTPPAAQHHGDRWRDPFADRLDALLQESRAERKRVVLFIHGEEVAGVVQDLGPGWVILSNQPEQEILLRTHQVERAELR